MSAPADELASVELSRTLAYIRDYFARHTPADHDLALVLGALLAALQVYATRSSMQAVVVEIDCDDAQEEQLPAAH